MNSIANFFLTRAWALEERTLHNLADLVGRHARGEKADPHEVDRIVQARDERRGRIRAGDRYGEAGDIPYELIGSTAVVRIEGIIARHANQVNDVSMPRGTSCEWIRDTLTACVADRKVERILLDVDSPGGVVNGIDDVVTAIRQARTEKPLISYAHGDMCSAAYWIASQANEVIAAPTASVGSIGVFRVVDDVSKRFEEWGTKRHVVRSGTKKAVGVEGLPISDTDLATMQREIDALHSVFVMDVALGRGMTEAKVREIADGDVHVGKDAVAAGLADRVMPFAELIESLEDQAFEPAPAASAASTEKIAMDLTNLTMEELEEQRPDLVEEIRNDANEEEEPDPETATDDGGSEEEEDMATAATLESDFPRASDAFKFKCLKKGVTRADSRLMYIRHLEEERDASASRERRDGMGTDPVGASGTGSGTSGTGTYQDEVIRVAKAEDLKIPVAMARVARSQPKLHEAWKNEGCPKIAAN